MNDRGAHRLAAPVVGRAQTGWVTLLASGIPGGSWLRDNCAEHQYFGEVLAVYLYGIAA